MDVHEVFEVGVRKGDLFWAKVLEHIEMKGASCVENILCLIVNGSAGLQDAEGIRLVYWKDHWPIT